MKFNDVIKVLKEENILVSYDEADIVFADINYNSQEVTNNNLFVCKGVSFKKEYLESAIEKGVIAYVSETDFEVNIPKIIVSDSRIALAVLSKAFYPDNVFKIGITGTKGKTTTNYFIHNILKHHLGYKPGIFATHYFYTGKNEQGKIQIVNNSDNTKTYTWNDDISNLPDGLTPNEIEKVKYYKGYYQSDTDSSTIILQFETVKSAKTEGRACSAVYLATKPSLLFSLLSQL